MKWRSIESAPKDRPVWLFVESEMHIYTGQHNKNGWFYIFREKGQFAYDGFHGGESSYAEIEPTHWCEIPESINAVL